MEEAQPLTDGSDGENESVRPGEEDPDAFREEGSEYGREDFRYDNIDQGEPSSGGTGGLGGSEAAGTLGQAVGLGAGRWGPL